MVANLSVIPNWNDAPGRTAAEVIAMLRAVAATEKARPPARRPWPWQTVAAPEPCWFDITTTTTTTPPLLVPA